MKRVAIGVAVLCTVAPFLLVATVVAALVAGNTPAVGGQGRLQAVEGVDPEVVRMVSVVTEATVTANPGCDADPLIVLAHMTIEWPPGLKGEGRNGTRMAANGDFQPIIQAYAPVPGPDRDGGLYDGSATAEYAVGPLQQINAFRDSYPRDGNDDSEINQNNLADATAVGIQHACATQQQSGLSLRTPEGRAFEAGHYMLPAYPMSSATADYRQLVTDAYNDLASRATWQNPARGTDEVRYAGDHAFPVDPALITNEAQLTNRHHNYPAWDLPIPTGTTVYAAAGGRVVLAGWSDACGNGVTIDADDGGRYTYCHGVATIATTNDHVTAGTPILLSGSTGHSTGPHLHLQIQYAGRFICPQPLLVAWHANQTLNPADTQRFDCIRG